MMPLEKLLETMLQTKGSMFVTNRPLGIGFNRLVLVPFVTTKVTSGNRVAVVCPNMISREISKEMELSYPIQSNVLTVFSFLKFFNNIEEIKRHFDTIVFHESHFALRHSEKLRGMVIGCVNEGKNTMVIL